MRVSTDTSVLTGEKQACEIGEELFSQVQLHFVLATVSVSTALSLGPSFPHLPELIATTSDVQVLGKTCLNFALDSNRVFFVCFLFNKWPHIGM